MTYHTGLSATEKRAFEEALTLDYLREIQVELLTLDHVPVSGVDMSARLIDGQVTVQANAALNSRALTATFEDHDATLQFDTGDPTDGFLYIDRMVRVRYCVYVLALLRWVRVPIFTGPITKLDRSGTMVNIEAAGKEELAGAVWKSYTIKKGTNKITAIKTMMQKQGETRFKLTATTGKLPNQLIMPPSAVTWAEAKRIAHSISHYMFYNGAGTLVSKRRNTSVQFTFSDGDHGAVLSEPNITFDPSTTRNVVRVIGKPKKNGKAPAWTAYPEIGHPLHPDRLGRNGRPRYLPEVIHNDNYRSVAACKTAAIERLEASIDQTVEVTFDSFVVPHLEPNDLCRLKTESFTSNFRLRTFTIPLNESGRMNVGYAKPQLINKRDIRRRRRA